MPSVLAGCSSKCELLARFGLGGMWHALHATLSPIGPRFHSEKVDCTGSLPLGHLEVSIAAVGSARLAPIHGSLSRDSHLDSGHVELSPFGD